jgi:phosphatidylserine/phosphatidylglycerophosphate/cardiolipin synthase-like enzyme
VELHHSAEALNWIGYFGELPKGIIVDHRRVLVGSHNWSGLGTTRNRDASLLFDDVEIAGYFEKVFLHDWTNLATTMLTGERGTPQVVADRSGTAPSVPAGYMLVPWESYYED